MNWLDYGGGKLLLLLLLKGYGYSIVMDLSYFNHEGKSFIFDTTRMYSRTRLGGLDS